MIEKLKLQLAFLESLNASQEFRSLPFWKPHQLSDGRWTFHVTANWRLTFRVDDEVLEVTVLDLEDYH